MWLWFGAAGYVAVLVGAEKAVADGENSLLCGEAVAAKVEVEALEVVMHA